MENNEVIGAGEARLNITYKGQQGDLPDAVLYDLEDQEVRRIVLEALVSGVPGIDPDENPDITDFVIDRFPAHEGVPYNRLSMRPKTPFGS